MKVVPFNQVGACRTGNLYRLSYDELVGIIGFEPNCIDDPDKVKYSWGFKVNGKHCGVWDYKGSHKNNSWSCYGPVNILEDLFGWHYTKKN